MSILESGKFDVQNWCVWSSATVAVRAVPLLLSYSHSLVFCSASHHKLTIMLLPTVVSLFFFFSATVQASPCVAFDTNWNLLAFGFDGKDWNAGTQDTWSSSQFIVTRSLRV